MSIFGTIMSKILGKAPESPPLLLRLLPLLKPLGRRAQRRPPQLRLHRRRFRGPPWMSPQSSMT
jgi:hypothetical protein